MRLFVPSFLFRPHNGNDNIDTNRMGSNDDNGGLSDLDLDISLSLNGGKDDPDRDDGDNDSSLDGGNSSTKSTPGNDEDYKMKDCHAAPHSNGVSDKNDDSNFS